MQDQTTTQSTELLSLITTRYNELKELAEVARAFGNADDIDVELTMWQDIYCLTEHGLQQLGEEV